MSNEKFKRGDIVRNVWAGSGNPYKYLMYIGKGTVKQGRYTHKVFCCIGYDGKKVNLFMDGIKPGEPSIEKIGHIDEYDKFMSALKMLKEEHHAE